MLNFRPLHLVRQWFVLTVAFGLFAISGFQPAYAQVSFDGAGITKASYSSTDSISPLAVDGSGDLFYVVDNGTSNTLYEIPAGGTPKALNSSFPYMPSALAVNASGSTLYFIYSDSGTSCNGTTYYQHLGLVSTAPSSTPGTLPQCFNFGSPTSYTGSYSDPQGLAVDSSGNLYVDDFGGGVIWKIPDTVTSSSVPTTYLNLNIQSNEMTIYGGTVYFAAYNFSTSKYVLYSASTSQFTANILSGAASSSSLANIPSSQSGMAVGPSGNIYIGGPSVIDKYSGGALSTVVSLPSGTNVSGVGVDSSGTLYYDAMNASGAPLVAQPGSSAVNFGSVAVGSSGSTISLPFTIAASSSTTVTGIRILTMGATGKDFTDAGSSTCTATTYASSTDCVVNVKFAPLFAGLRRGAVEFVNGSTVLSTTYIYGTGTGPQVAFSPGIISSPVGGGTSTAAGYSGSASGVQLAAPGGVALDGAGNLYIADTLNNVIRKVNLASNSITTVAGNGTPGFTGDNGAATSAELYDPADIAVDGAGNLYIADSGNNRVREVNAVTGLITTVAGDGTAGYTGDNGAATSAELNNPKEIAVDGAGNLYIADASNNVIRKINAATGTITTVAGTGTAGYTGDNGAATSAELYHPDGVAVDGAGNLYIADTLNDVVREVNAATGKITTIAGTGAGGYTGDGGPATSAKLGSPAGIEVDAAGNLYIADYNDYVIRKVNTTTGIISTAAGTGTAGYTGDNGAATSATLNAPRSVAVGTNGNLYIADTGNNVIRKVDVADAPSLSFASTYVGSTSTDSPQTVTVENIGNATLTFPIPTIAGAYNPSVPTNFAYDNTSSCIQNGASASTAFTLTPGANCTMLINFAPTTSGSISGNVVLTDNDGNAPAPNYATQGISVSGTGLNPVTQLAFATAPPTTVTAGGNAGTITVDEEDSGGAIVSSAADSITLTVAGPSSYSQTYTEAAVSGVATFKLSSATLQTAGSYTYTAKGSTYTQVTALETVNAGSASTISAVSGGGQSAVIGAAFSSPLLVKVLDAYGNPVSGATVAFSAPSSGASAALSTPGATGSNGETSVTATANGIASTTAYSVSASVSGTSTPASFALTNTKHTTTLTVTPSAATLTYGQPVTVTATISPSTISSTVPTGSVTFHDGATTLTPTETVSNAAASYTVNVPTVGTHMYAANYSGDTNFQASAPTMASSNVVVNRASSTVAGSSSTTVTYGNSTSIHVTVSGQYSGAGIATPSGTIGYAISGTSISGTAAISSGAATIPVANTLAAGSYTVSITYAGDTNYKPATNISIPLTVSKATATVTLGGLSQTYTGSPLSATATTTPSGLGVSMTYNGSPTAPTAVGSYAVVATVKNSNYKGSATGTLVIGQATPAITWPAPAAITYGTALSATQMDATATYNGSPIAGTYVYLPAAGTILTAGAHTLSVQFTPFDSKDYATPPTDTTSITVNQAGSAVSVASSTSNANLNANVTFTATVRSATTGTPTGSVEFLEGSTVLGSGQLDNSGVATYTISTLTAGLHQITAVYQGDINFKGSTSAPLAQMVTAPAFSLTSSTTSLSLKTGQTGKVTISMLPVGGFKGNVQFTCSGLPTESRCTFSPSTLAAYGSNTAQTSTLTITTSGSNSGTVALATHPGKPNGVMLAGIFWLPGLLFGGFLFWQRRKLTAKYQLVLLLVLAVTTLSGMVGCGFQTPMTGPGTSTVTVTGSSGSSAQTVTIYVKVTQ